MDSSSEGLDSIGGHRKTLAGGRVGPRVTVVGLGGAGCNMISWIKERGLTGGRLVAANTDAAHLSVTNADCKILIGDKLTYGQGAGGYPQRGAAATRESLGDLRRETEGSDVVILCAGLGAGTGTGATEVLSKELREPARLIIGVVTLPFIVERFRYDNAKSAVRILRQYCDIVVVIDNGMVSKVMGGLPMQQALGIANELVGELVRSITETVTSHALGSIDIEDLTAACKLKGLAAMGVGEADGTDRVEKAMMKALDRQFLDVSEVGSAQGIIIEVLGGPDLTMEEVARAGALLGRLPTRAKKIVWGARVDRGLDGHVKVIVVLTGIESALFARPPEHGQLGPLRIGQKS
jgi:cell division protein FtsZ